MSLNGLKETVGSLEQKMGVTRGSEIGQIPLSQCEFPLPTFKEKLALVSCLNVLHHLRLLLPSALHWLSISSQPRACQRNIACSSMSRRDWWRVISLLKTLIHNCSFVLYKPLHILIQLLTRASLPSPHLGAR